MDINTRKTQLVQGLTLVAAGSAIAHGYKFGPEEMEKIGQPLVEEGIARFVIDRAGTQISGHGLSESSAPVN